jgi:hypothetical protein
MVKELSFSENVSRRLDASSCSLAEPPGSSGLLVEQGGNLISAKNEHPMFTFRGTVGRDPSF